MIRGTKRKIDKNENVTRINPTVKASIHNRFDIEVVDAKTGEVKQKAYAENVILNNWWNIQFRSLSSYGGCAASAIFIGRGSGTPSASDKDLFSRIGVASSVSSSYDLLDNQTFIYEKKAKIDETTYVGETITEIGLGENVYTSGTVTTHAMLKDMNGNQISILKTNTDIINFCATVFVHLSERKFSGGSIELVPFAQKLKSNNSYYSWYSTVLSWMAGASDIAYAFPPSTEDILFDFGKAPNTLGRRDLASDTTIVFTVNKSNKSVRLELPRRKTGDDNGEIGVVTINECHGGNYNGGKDYYWSPLITLKVGGDWFQGSNVSQEAIATADGEIKDFSTKFSYISNHKIYLNGEEQSNGLTVTKGLCKNGSSQAGRYLALVSPDSSLENVFFAPAVITHTNNSLYVDLSPITNQEKTFYIFNPNYLEVPITKVSYSNPAKLLVYGKTDEEDWTYISSVEGSSMSISISSKNRNFAFYKLVFEEAANWSGYEPMSFTVYCDTPVVNNIHFDEPPPAGAIITADYFTETIAKDENHVFDLSLTIQLGEYTGE